MTTRKEALADCLALAQESQDALWALTDAILGHDGSPASAQAVIAAAEVAWNTTSKTYRQTTDLRSLVYAGFKRRANEPA